MEIQPLVFQQLKDMTVTAYFPGVPDGTGMEAIFWRKTNRYMSDLDPATISYGSSLIADPDDDTQTMAVFDIPGDDNDPPEYIWWRIDVTDSSNSTQTPAGGPLWIEAV